MAIDWEPEAVMDDTILVGTEQSLLELSPVERLGWAGHEVTALARGKGRWWAILDGRRIVVDRDGSWTEAAVLADGIATCLAPSEDGLLVGAAGAHLYRLEGERLTRVEGFENVAGRETWYTSWGDPADTRSLSVDRAGTVYVNIHVGGVGRSTDGGKSWRPTLDIETDVHQVLAHPNRPGRVFAASAVGLVITEDAGETWRTVTDGLHATYMRAVAVADDAVLVSVSTGPGGRQSALYRAPLAGGAFERCRKGLPRWFGDNVDTHCLAARGRAVVLGTEDGRVFVSEDGGQSFGLAARGLPPVRCVALAETG
jgi:hypothetical protein